MIPQNNYQSKRQMLYVKIVNLSPLKWVVMHLKLTSVVQKNNVQRLN